MAENKKFEIRTAGLKGKDIAKARTAGLNGEKAPKATRVLFLSEALFIAAIAAVLLSPSHGRS